MGRVRRCWIACWLTGVLSASVAAAPAVVLTLHDAIGPASADYVLRGLERARAQGAPLVVLELDTPGGLDTSMRQIVKAILASPVPVATYVSPSGARAASAGTYLLLASHVAAMAPATALGAATPVEIGMPGLPGPGDQPATTPRPDAMGKKQINDAAALIRGLAERHGRNATWAESAVREGASLTASEAQRERVVDVVARDLPDLLAQIDGRQVRTPGGESTLRTRELALERHPPDWRHRLLGVIANPSLALILLMIGFYGLLFEFMSPGLIVPGVVGGICLLLGLFALQLLPTEVAAVALLLFGLALLAAELVLPSFGVLGAGGLVAVIAGGVMLYDSEAPGLGVPLPLVFGLAASMVLAVLVTGGLALRSRRAPQVSGVAGLLGARAEVVSVAPGESWAMVRGERWRVRATGPLRVGQSVRVTSVEGLTLCVSAEPLPASAAERSEEGELP